MRYLALLTALSYTVLLATGEHAAAPVAVNKTPATISGGVGWYDFRKSDDEAVDFRLEYRHDKDFLWLMKPWGGIEATTDGGVWGGVGVMADVTFFDSIVLTASFAPGLYEAGGGKDLGHVIEFRSQIELGYQFGDRSRLSVAVSHSSNAELAYCNPGTEVLSLYYHLPLDVLF